MNKAQSFPFFMCLKSMVISLKNYKLSIMSNDRNLYEGEAVELITEDINGRIGILAGHFPYITFLVPSKTIFITENQEKKELFISKGMLIIDTEIVRILCKSGEFKEEINKDRAKQAKERAEKRLKEKNEKIDLKRVEEALVRALVRLKI